MFSANDYIHASDIARSIIALVGNEAEGIYNLGSAEPIATKILLNMIYEKFGKELKIKIQNIISNNLEELWNELDNFSSEVNSILPLFKDELVKARSNTQRFDQNPNYRDLYDLTEKIEKEIPVLSLREASKSLRKAINKTVMFESDLKNSPPCQNDG